MESYTLPFKKVRTFNWKGIYFFIKRYIRFNEKVYTFLRKDTVVFLKGTIVSFKKYYPFIKKVPSFYKKLLSFSPAPPIMFEKTVHLSRKNNLRLYIIRYL